MLDVAATNCWIEYKMEQERSGQGGRKNMLQMMEFKLRLAEQLIEEGSKLDQNRNRIMSVDDAEAGPSDSQRYDNQPSPRVPVPSVNKRQEGPSTCLKWALGRCPTTGAAWLDARSLLESSAPPAMCICV